MRPFLSIYGGVIRLWRGDKAMSLELALASAGPAGTGAKHSVNPVFVVAKRAPSPIVAAVI